MAKIEVVGLSKSFDGTRALRDVSWTVAGGEILAVCGENGAGKSTLMKILSGAIAPDQGEIYLEGRRIEIRSPRDAIQLGIRTVHQELSLLPHLSVAENILLGRMPSRHVAWMLDWPSTRLTAQKALASLGLDSADVGARTDSLSVSVQQVIEIAKALIDTPKVLILDEPTAVLSARETATLFDLIRKLRAVGTTVIYISHRIEEIFEISDRVLVLKDGAAVLDMQTHQIDREMLIRAMVGRPLSTIYPLRKSAPGDVVLECRNLCRTPVFKDVSLSIRAGEVIGMFGLVGSGRSDLAKALFGAVPATSGEILVSGTLVTIDTPEQAIANGIAMVTEERKHDGLALDLTAIDNGGLASMAKVSRNGILNRRAQARLVGSKLDQLDVRPRDHFRIARRFSGGNQQKIVLAKWLMVDNLRLLILDEPTRGVDIATKVEIYRMIAELADAGRAVLLISSEMPEVLGMSDRLLIMRAGHLVTELGRKDFSMETVFALAAGVEQTRKTA